MTVPFPAARKSSQACRGTDAKDRKKRDGRSGPLICVSVRFKKHSRPFGKARLHQTSVHIDRLAPWKSGAAVFMSGVYAWRAIGGMDMWGRKKLSKEASIPETAWDDKTQKAIAEKSHFEIQITSVVRLQGFGTNERGSIPSLSYEIHGLITFPKLIVVEISDASGEHFGGWSYDQYSQDDAKVPFLRVWLSDDDGEKRRTIYNSHMAALISGGRSSMLRLWKREGDGIMNEVDREHGYSYSSQYPLLGMYSWSDLEATTLPDWAVPCGSDRFSWAKRPGPHLRRI